MEADRRSASSWVGLIARVLAFVGFATALIVQGQLGIALGAAGVGLLVAPLAFRSKAAKPADALYSCSADLSMADGKKLPGQLSLTANKVVWMPSRYSLGHGADQVSIAMENDVTISVRRGAGLMDLIVTVSTGDGEERRFLTHQSRRLRRAVEQVTG